MLSSQKFVRRHMAMKKKKKHPRKEKGTCVQNLKKKDHEEIKRDMCPEPQKNEKKWDKCPTVELAT